MGGLCGSGEALCIIIFGSGSGVNGCCSGCVVLVMVVVVVVVVVWY